jgi:hypothetical protein
MTSQLVILLVRAEGSLLVTWTLTVGIYSTQQDYEQLVCSHILVMGDSVVFAVHDRKFQQVLRGIEPLRSMSVVVTPFVQPVTVPSTYQNPNTMFSKTCTIQMD